MTSSSIFDAERLSKIGQIMPRFSEHAQVGDEIMFGLEGDPQFPKDFETARPTGTIIKVKTTNQGNAFKVRMNSGKIVHVPPNSVDPQRVWEFTDDAFAKVLERSIQKESPEPPAAAAMPDYRGTSESAQIQKLQDEIVAMKQSFEREVAETRNFNNTLIATINEISADVCKSNPDANFCKVFNSEYKSMIGDGNKSAAPAASPFDSDFSDSDGEDGF